MLRRVVHNKCYLNPTEKKYNDTALCFLELPVGYHADYVQNVSDHKSRDFDAFLAMELMPLLRERYGFVTPDDLEGNEGAVILFHEEKAVAWMVLSKIWTADGRKMGIESEFFDFGDPKATGHLRQLILCVEAFVKTRFQVYEVEKDSLVDACTVRIPTPAVFLVFAVERERRWMKKLLSTMGFKKAYHWYLPSDCVFYELQVDVDSSLCDHGPMD
jgi:hypothetical protein